MQASHFVTHRFTDSSRCCPIREQFRLVIYGWATTNHRFRLTVHRTDAQTQENAPKYWRCAKFVGMWYYEILVLAYKHVTPCPVRGQASHGEASIIRGFSHYIVPNISGNNSALVTAPFVIRSISTALCAGNPRFFHRDTVIGSIPSAFAILL